MDTKNKQDIEKLEIEMSGKKVTIILIMLAASLSVILPLTVFHNLLTVFLLYYLGFCFVMPMVDIVVIQKQTITNFIRFIGFSKRNLGKSLTVGFGHGIILYFLIVGGYLLFANYFSFSNVLGSLRQWGTLAEKKWIVFLIMVIFNGFFEEIFWRGYLFGKLTALMPTKSVILLITLFYTSYHLATLLSFFGISWLSLLSIAGIFMLGLLWGWMRHRYNSLWAPAIGHVLTTFAYMTIYLLLE